MILRKRRGEEGDGENRQMKNVLFFQANATIILTIMKIAIQKLITVILAIMILKVFVMIIVVKVMIEVMFYSFKLF